MIDTYDDLTDDELRGKIKGDIKDCQNIKAGRLPCGEYDQNTDEFYYLLDDSIDMITRLIPTANRQELLVYMRLINYERRVVSDKFLNLAKDLMTGKGRDNGLQAQIDRRSKAIAGMTEAEAALWDIDDASINIQKQIEEGNLFAEDLRDALTTTSIQAEKLRAAINGGDDVQIGLEHKVLINESWKLNDVLTEAFTKAHLKKISH